MLTKQQLNTVRHGANLPRLNLYQKLLPVILQYIVKPGHLAVLCLVNKSFYAFCIPYLYQRAFIYAWHKEGKAKVIKLFRTLADYPHLARFVQQLVIRDFPKTLHSTDPAHGLEMELEINGRHEGHYDPQILSRFTRLRKISLIMPSSSVIDVLPSWTRSTGNSLRNLTLICKSSTVVNDGLLEAIAPNVNSLEYLSMVGCPKVTHEGLWVILSANSKGILAIGMEGLSPAFDMGLFSMRCQRSGVLSRLRSITLTVDEHTSIIAWQTNVLTLLSQSPLEQFHISTVGGHVGYRLSDQFCADIVDAHGARLRRFSVHRMRMSLEAIDDICCRCVSLEQLFIVVDQDDMNGLGPCLARARRLRAVHVSRPLDFGSEDVPMQSREHIISIARQCSPSVRQFGFNTRVFQVERVAKAGEDGSVTTDVLLSAYESPEIPEQFLVVRT
ncbi:hypothetical protein A0H81_03102 [Grifola frondosa]|uniref:F-box domain-containing protein n=1 Tax=Grifola frondosa TaxID=5627 RepID=A0A1C7MJA0_GRIFR|nr:hypothetical protein A0H81_03102 [Grifola frondosa]